MSSNTTKKGIPFVLSGPSGCGKGTIVRALLDKYPDAFALSVSATTRPPRAGEVDGVHYSFISKEEFEHRIAHNEILEYTSYCGNYYGTPKKEIDERTARGVHVILEIEVEGAMHVRSLCPQAILIFVLPPDFRTLEGRLRGRGTNTEEDIRRRLERAKEEIGYLNQYDYIIVNENDGAEAAAEEIAGIIRAEQHKVARQPGAADAFLQSGAAGDESADPSDSKS